MNRNQKKVLYESIMKQVSKALKNKLNESSSLIQASNQFKKQVLRFNFSTIPNDVFFNKMKGLLDDEEILNHQYDTDWWGNNIMNLKINVTNGVFVGEYLDEKFDSYGFEKKYDGNTCGSIYDKDGELIGKFIDVTNCIVIIALPDYIENDDDIFSKKTVLFKVIDDLTGIHTLSLTNEAEYYNNACIRGAIDGTFIYFYNQMNRERFSAY